MATLIRPRVSSHEPHDTYHDFALNVPKPFPSRAEREQEDLLESLESEELQLDDAVSSTHSRAHIEQTGALVSGPNPDASSEVVLNHRSVSRPTIPFRIDPKHLQRYRKTCYPP